MRRIIAREALLAWKARMERERPRLLLRREEIEQKAGNLKTWDDEMRKLNSGILADHIDRSRMDESAMASCYLAPGAECAAASRGIRSRR